MFVHALGALRFHACAQPITRAYHRADMEIGFAFLMFGLHSMTKSMERRAQSEFMKLRLDTTTVGVLARCVC